MSVRANAPDMRTCLDCGATCTGPRCPAHTRRYGRPQQRARAQWIDAINTGRVTCARCPELIQPTEPWDLDHIRGALSPSHQRCNRAAPD